MKFAIVLLAAVLAVAEADIAGTNVALSGTASQSSVGYGGIPQRAIDGRTSGTWNDASCTQTKDRSKNNWWKVDLAGSREVFVHKVQIFNRADCCQDRLKGIQVYVDNHLCGGIDWKQGKLSYAVTCDHKGSSVTVKQNTGKYLTLCEVKVFAKNAYLNVAKRKAAWQTSTGWGGLASRAVDGNTSGKWNSKSCTHTEKPGVSQYWFVRLGKSVRVAYVTIYNRMDSNQERINGVTVYAVNGLTNTRRKCGVIKYIKNQRAYEIQCNFKFNANQIYIYSGKSYLTLCEVEVMVKA